MADLSLLTVNECADLLRRHPSTIYRRLESGAWDAFAWKDGKDWRIERDEMLTHLRSRPVPTRHPAEDPMPRVAAPSRDRFRAIMAQKEREVA